MIIRIVRMQLLEGKAEAFLSIFREVNKEILRSPGCVSVSINLDAGDKDTVITLSHWENEASLQAYRASALFINTWRRVKPFFREKALAFSMVETE